MPREQTTQLFTHKSEAYAKYRAGYPDEAIQVILEPFTNEKKISVVDVGAGTGIASRLLAEHGAQVISVEPNASMIKAAEPHSNVRFIQSGAESIPLEDHTADVVTSFQAFHWFNFNKSLREFNRILKSGGHLALIWNYWDVQDPFTSSYAELINEATRKNPNRIDPYDGFSGKIKKMRVRLLWKLQYLPYYKNVQRHTFSLTENMDLESLIGCARSQSYIDHIGPEWDELTEKIEKLYHENKPARLNYRINVFTAEPGRDNKAGSL